LRSKDQIYTIFCALQQNALGKGTNVNSWRRKNCRSVETVHPANNHGTMNISPQSRGESFWGPVPSDAAAGFEEGGAADFADSDG
jgi:hypothetical protein